MKSDLMNQLKKVKLFLFDVDGILTDGKLLWDSNEKDFLRFFHIRDGYAIRLLLDSGYKVGIISGGKSNNVRSRFETLGVDYLHLGHINKIGAYEECLQAAGVTDSETLYMGDELFDIPVLKRVGFSATVPGATDEVKQHVDYVTAKPGGEGAVREVIDHFRLGNN